jgi:hypothetical protein
VPSIAVHFIEPAAGRSTQVKIEALSLIDVDLTNCGTTDELLRFNIKRRLVKLLELLRNIEILNRAVGTLQLPCRLSTSIAVMPISIIRFPTILFSFEPAMS